MSQVRKLIVIVCWVVFLFSIGPGALEALFAGMGAEESGKSLKAVGRFAILAAMLCLVGFAHGRWSTGQGLHPLFIVLLAFVGVAAFVPAFIRPHNFETLATMMPVFPLSLYIACEQIVWRATPKASP